MRAVWIAYRTYFYASLHYRLVCDKKHLVSSLQRISIEEVCEPRSKVDPCFMWIAPWRENHNIWPWPFPLRHIASSRRQVASNIAEALSSSSPHGIREHKNVNTISRLPCQHAKSQYNNQEGKCYQLWTLQWFCKEWW